MSGDQGRQAQIVIHQDAIMDLVADVAALGDFPNSATIARLRVNAQRILQQVNEGATLAKIKV